MSNKLYGLIGAMQMETEALVADMTDKTSEILSGVTYTRGTLCGKSVVVCTSGVGKVFAAMAAEAMAVHYHVDALLNTGVAGGLIEGLKVTDAVVASSVVQHDMDTTPLGDPRGFLTGPDIVSIETDKHLSKALLDAARALQIPTTVGVVASGDLFVSRPSTKEKIRNEFHAAACEMEGAAIGAVAYMNRIPFAVLRTISDGGDGMEFSAFAPIAARNSVAVTKEFLKRV